MKVLTIAESATTAGLSRRHFERLIAQGEGPGIIRLSTRRVGVLQDELEQWVLARRVAPPNDVYRPPISTAE
jgi:predicted DNA-binding transcriptional regulator AlpA